MAPLLFSFFPVDIPALKPIISSGVHRNAQCWSRWPGGTSACESQISGRRGGPPSRFALFFFTIQNSKFSIHPQSGLFKANQDMKNGEPSLRSEGFQTCCIAGFQAGSPALWPVGLETRDTADLEVCAALNRYPAPAGPGHAGGTAKNPSKPPLGPLSNEG